MPEISREDFIRDYCLRSGITVSQQMERFDAVPCECDYELCEGWKMVPRECLEMERDAN